MSLWLNDDEVYELTGYRRRVEQRLALGEMGIDFRSRPADGFPLVLRSQFENLTPNKKRRDPDYSAITKAS